MELRSFFLEEPAHILAVVVALGFFAGGAVALTQDQGVATVFLMLGGFGALLFLEYRRLNYEQ